MEKITVEYAKVEIDPTRKRIFDMGWEDGKGGKKPLLWSAFPEFSESYGPYMAGYDIARAGVACGKLAPG